MRRVLLLILAFTFICAPLLADDGTTADSSGAATGSSGGCGKVNLGSAPGEDDSTSADLESSEDPDAYLQDQALYNESQQGEMLDLQCSEQPNPDGTYTCINTDGTPLSCVDENGELVCYQ